MCIVGFGFSFGLVIFINLGIDPKIIGVACVRSSQWNYYSNHLYMNESPLLVKISYIPVCILCAKCWPFKYWRTALSSEICKKIRVHLLLRSSAYVQVCACVCCMRAILKPRICEHAEWFANRLRMVHDPNARMCRRDYKPALRCLRTVRIQFVTNWNLLVFCANTKRIGCAGYPLYVPGVLCSPQVCRKLINHAPSANCLLGMCVPGLRFLKFRPWMDG